MITIRNNRYDHQSNYQDLLKFLAIIAMTIDHVGLYFFPECFFMRLIGRTAMPIFCFFAGYNFKGTVRFKVLLFGIFLQMITMIIFQDFVTTNILIPIFLGQCYLRLFSFYLKKFDTGYYHVITLSSLWYFTWTFVDYGTLVLACMILGYIAQNDKVNFKITVFISIIISIFHTLAIFNPHDFDLITVLIFAVLEYFIMTVRNFNDPITLNLKWMSRNVLFIYFAQLAIIELAWFYHLIGWW